MECIKCTKEIPLSKAKFCPFCGAKIELPSKMIVKGYLHGEKESNYDQAEKIGLSEKSAANFVDWGYEVEFDLEVERETGNTKIIAVDGHKLLY